MYLVARIIIYSENIDFCFALDILLVTGKRDRNKSFMSPRKLEEDQRIR